MGGGSPDPGTGALYGTPGGYSIPEGKFVGQGTNPTLQEFMRAQQKQKIWDTLTNVGRGLVAAGSARTPGVNPFASGISQGLAASPQQDPLRQMLTFAQIGNLNEQAAERARQRSLEDTRRTSYGKLITGIKDNPRYAAIAPVMETLDPQAGTALYAKLMTAPKSSVLTPEQAQQYHLPAGPVWAMEEGPGGPKFTKLYEPPQPKPGVDVPYSPAVVAQKRELALAGKPETKNYGTIPPGYRMIQGADGSMSMVPIPGSPAALKAEAEVRSARDQQAANAETQATSANSMIDATQSIKKIMNESDTPAVGTVSRAFAVYSGSPAGKVRSYVKALQSGVALGAMKRLKEASKTGATGFGAMSEKELSILINEIGALDPDNTDPQIFLKTINRIEAQQKRVIEDIRKNVSPERIRELGLEPLLGITQAPTKYPDAPPQQFQRQVGTVYQTPKGPATWTPHGWVLGTVGQ